MKTLVTGGGGFVGSNLALTLEKSGHKVIVLDDFSNSNKEHLIDFKGEVISESINSVNLDRLQDVDVIFHCAAITDTIVRDEKLMMQVNFDGSKRLLEFAIANNKKFIYSSSAAVYGDASVPIKEDMAGKPKNIYGVSKWEFDCLAVKCMKDAHIVGLRYFNVFGPRESHKGKMASMLWQLRQQMLSGKRPRIFKWGEQKRDQVYVKDVVKANILGVEAKKSAIVNVGSGRAITFNHIIKVLNEVLETKLESDYFDNPYENAYQNYTQADLTMAKDVLGYTPEWSFEDAVWDYMKHQIPKSPKHLNT